MALGKLAFGEMYIHVYVLVGILVETIQTQTGMQLLYSGLTVACMMLFCCLACSFNQLCSLITQVTGYIDVLIQTYRYLTQAQYLTD
jgi:hypothetical protein